jgi:alkylhydroperoxidase family enzyme
LRPGSGSRRSQPTWPDYDLDPPTRSLPRYASKLTESPSRIDAEDIAALERSGWDADAIWEITALTSFFNCSGRPEAASGLPPDRIPEHAKLAEARGA